MQWVRLWNETQDKVLCERCAIADNLVTRVRGLLGRTHLPADEGLLITRCPSIHMFGMKFAIDVVFLNVDDVVVDWVENIAPGKLYAAKVPEFQAGNRQVLDVKAWKKIYAAKTAVELPAGTLDQNPIQVFDQLRRNQHQL
jgi:uncharacterized membrane protein (UPF0127 family)